MARKPTTIDEYLAAVKGEKRAALDKLRKTIRTIVPKAEECISYGIPAFRLGRGAARAGLFRRPEGRWPLDVTRRVPEKDSGALRRGVEAAAGRAEHGPEDCSHARPRVVPGAGLQPGGSPRAPHSVPLGGRRW